MMLFKKIFFSLVLLTCNLIYCADYVMPFAGPLLVPVLNKYRNKTEPERDKRFVDPKDIQETFDSVILEDEIKDKFKIIVQFLKDPERFKQIGVNAPKGILLHGPPGTGKTTLGRALAKETNCNFLYISAPEIDDMWVGTGAQKIKEAFDLAKKNAPTIIFIDEIDTIAKKRLSIESRHHTQTLQQFLVELDGFKKIEKPIVVIATTNNKNQLDSALLRSGRFDMHIEITNPSPDNIKKIFDKNLKKIKLAPFVTQNNIKELCATMNGFSGADIENVVNQASLNALMNKKTAVELVDLQKAVDSIKVQK